MKTRIWILMTLCIAVALQTVKAQVASWQLNNDARDATSSLAQGILMYSPTFTNDAKEGTHALSLNGTNQYITFGNPAFPSGTSPRTISAWAKTNTVTGYHMIFAYGTGAAGKAMFIGQNGTQLVGGSYANDLAVNNYWAVGVWHHICLTYDGTTARLYADGVQVASAAKAWNLALSKVFLGRQVNEKEYWSGLIDDVRVYNTALTPAQVQALAISINAPTGLKALATSSSTIDLTWVDASTNETGFEIERSATPGTGYSLLTTTAPNTLSYSDASGVPNTTYYYRVKAVTSTASSMYAAEVSAKTSAPGGCANIYCDNEGGVGIGTPDVPHGFRLAVNGKVMAEGVKVALQTEWPDYVFEKDYALTDIPTLKKYINENGHLPNVPKASVVEKEGIDVAEINIVLLEKIEELSLYLIQMEERIKSLERENETLRKQK